jgi:hypothetical protein
MREVRERTVPLPAATELGRGVAAVVTFTLICHLGKTYTHQSRGDTPWEAQTRGRGPPAPPVPVPGDTLL